MDPIQNPGQLANVTPGITPGVPAAPGGGLDLTGLFGEGGGITLYDPNEPATPAPNAPAGTPNPNAQPIVIKGKSYMPDQLAALVEKGENATQRWQEAADLRRQAQEQLNGLGEGREVVEVWNTLTPALRNRVLQMIETEARGGAPSMPPIAPAGGVKAMTWEDLSDEGRFILHSAQGAVQSVIAPLQRQLQDMAGILQRLAPEIQASSAERRDAAAVQALAARGIQITPQQAREMRERGVDPVAAMEMFGPALQQNFAAGAKQGQSQGAAQPTEAPNGAALIYDPDDPDLTTDRELQLLSSGYQPVYGSRLKKQ